MGRWGAGGPSKRRGIYRHWSLRTVGEGTPVLVLGGEQSAGQVWGTPGGQGGGPDQHGLTGQGRRRDAIRATKKSADGQGCPLLRPKLGGDGSEVRVLLEVSPLVHGVRFPRGTGKGEHRTVNLSTVTFKHSPPVSNDIARAPAGPGERRSARKSVSEQVR